MSTQEELLAAVHPSERVLLLSHCLRNTGVCKGKFTKRGLECGDCEEDCVLNRLSRTAIKAGYKGVCIAPGGKLALRFVEEMRPKGVVAVACDKELEEGVAGVKNLEEAIKHAPAIVVVPLTKDGCVDTEVDEVRVVEAIHLGFSKVAASVGRTMPVVSNL